MMKKFKDINGDVGVGAESRKIAVLKKEPRSFLRFMQKIYIEPF